MVKILQHPRVKFMTVTLLQSVDYLYFCLIWITFLFFFLGLKLFLVECHHFIKFTLIQSCRTIKAEQVQ